MAGCTAAARFAHSLGLLCMCIPAGRRPTPAPPQDAALQKAAALEAAQAATLARLAEAQAAVGGVFELVEGRAAELAAAAGLQADAQRALAAELGGLVEGSRGIRSAVDVVIGYQQRSDSGGMGGWVGGWVGGHRRRLCTAHRLPCCSVPPERLSIPCPPVRTDGLPLARLQP